MSFKARIQKFLVIPICSVYDDESNLVKEEKVRPITVYENETIDFKDLGKKLEEKLNNAYFSKLKSKKAE